MLSKGTLAGLLVVLIAVLAMVPSAALAATPLSPALTASTPPSPGASLTPRIQGQAEGLITAALGPNLSASGARIATSGNSVSGTVTIYAEEPNCSNSNDIAGEGSASEFEHSGIEVRVAPDSTTTFFATLANENGSSPCSAQGFTYRQVTTAPEPPSFESVTPASPANNLFPHLIGSAPVESVVYIYSTPDCSGPPLGSGSAATFATEGIVVPVTKNSLTTFYARVTLAGIPSTCSTSSIEYQDVAPPPSEEPQPPSEEPNKPGTEAPPQQPGVAPEPPRLHLAPSRRSNDETPLVSATAAGAGSVELFENANCSGAPVAKGSAAQLAAGMQVQVPENKTTSFYGVSVGAGGVQSACSAPVVYVEDSLAPSTKITMGPGTRTRRNSVVFRFVDTTGNEPGTAFFCKMDRHKWRSCDSPFRVKHLSHRRHLFEVTAIDPAGNREASPVRQRFSVTR